jgi:hypothetical protein
MADAGSIVTEGQNHDRLSDPPNTDEPSEADAVPAVPVAAADNEVEVVAAPGQELAPNVEPQTHGNTPQGNNGGTDAMDTTPDATPPRPEQEPLTPPPPPQSSENNPPSPSPDNTADNTADQSAVQDAETQTQIRPSSPRPASPPAAVEGETNEAAETNDQSNTMDVNSSPPADSDNTPDGSPPPDEEEEDTSWAEIHEDTSEPTADELKEIEEEGEHSALDRKFSSLSSNFGQTTAADRLQMSIGNPRPLVPLMNPNIPQAPVAASSGLWNTTMVPRRIPIGTWS